MPPDAAGYVARTTQEINLLTAEVQRHFFTQILCNPTFIDYQIGINNPIVAGLTRYTLEIRTPLGGLVRRLVDELAAPGFYTAAWDGRNERGERVASGVYYYQLHIGPIVQLNKLLFLK